MNSAAVWISTPAIVLPYKCPKCRRSPVSRTWALAAMAAARIGRSLKSSSSEDGSSASGARETCTERMSNSNFATAVGRATDRFLRASAKAYPEVISLTGGNLHSRLIPDSGRYAAEKRILASRKTCSTTFVRSRLRRRAAIRRVCDGELSTVRRPCGALLAARADNHGRQLHCSVRIPRGAPAYMSRSEQSRPGE